MSGLVGRLAIKARTRTRTRENKIGLGLAKKFRESMKFSNLKNLSRKIRNSASKWKNWCYIYHCQTSCWSSFLWSKFIFTKSFCETKILKKMYIMQLEIILPRGADSDSVDSQTFGRTRTRTFCRTRESGLAKLFGKIPESWKLIYLMKYHWFWWLNESIITRRQ